MINLKNLFSYIIKNLYISIIISVIIILSKNFFLVNSSLYKKQNFFLTESYVYFNFDLSAVNSSSFKNIILKDYDMNSYDFKIKKVKVDNFKNQSYIFVSHLSKSNKIQSQINQNINQSFKKIVDMIIKFQPKAYSILEFDRTTGQEVEIYLENKKRDEMLFSKLEDDNLVFYTPEYEIIYQTQQITNKYGKLIDISILFIIIANVFGSYFFFIRKDLKKFFKNFSTIKLAK